MESKKKMEMIKQAIKQLIDEEKANTPSSSSSSPATSSAVNDQNPGQHHLLSKLLSQVESLEEEDESNKEKRESSHEDDNEDIVKDLKEVKKQNSITQRLLSAMIVVTLIWQLSEVSLIWKIKNGISNPFKAIGGFFKSHHNVQEAIKHVDDKRKQVMGTTALPGVKVPELPQVDLPGTKLEED